MEHIDSKVFLSFTEVAEKGFHTDPHSTWVLKFESRWYTKNVEKRGRIFSDQCPGSSCAFASGSEL